MGHAQRAFWIWLGSAIAAAPAGGTGCAATSAGATPRAIAGDAATHRAREPARSCVGDEVPAAWRACARDAECVELQGGACNASFVAVARTHVEQARALLIQGCASIACASGVSPARRPLPVACVRGRCVHAGVGADGAE